MMLRRYEEFLSEFDKLLEKFFQEQKPYIKCRPKCSACCETGDYPFSRLEMEYLMSGFISLPKEIQDKIRENIRELKAENPKEYKCPFLIDKLCSLYSKRGLTCRTHGLAYLFDGKIKLPECANNNLNYSGIYNTKTHEINIENPIKTNLRIDGIFNSEMAKKYNLESGEIRRLLDWF